MTLMIENNALALLPLTFSFHAAPFGDVPTNRVTFFSNPLPFVLARSALLFFDGLNGWLAFFLRTIVAAEAELKQILSFDPHGGQTTASIPQASYPPLYSSLSLPLPVPNRFCLTFLPSLFRVDPTCRLDHSISLLHNKLDIRTSTKPTELTLHIYRWTARWIQNSL